MKKYIDNEWISVDLLIDNKTLKAVWKQNEKKVINQGQFQEIFNSILDALKDYGLDKFADDTTEMGVVPVSCQQWMVSDFFPKAIDAGLRKISIINSQDIFAVSAVKNVLNKVSDQVTVETFKDRTSAFDWLEEPAEL